MVVVGTEDTHAGDEKRQRKRRKRRKNLSEIQSYLRPIWVSAGTGEYINLDVRNSNGKCSN